MKLSVIVAVATTILSTCLGTLAALGLSRSNIPGRATIMAVLISPMIVPVIISAIGLFFFYAYVGLNGSLLGIISGSHGTGHTFCGDHGDGNADEF